LSDIRQALHMPLNLENIFTAKHSFVQVSIRREHCDKTKDCWILSGAATVATRKVPLLYPANNPSRIDIKVKRKINPGVRLGCERHVRTSVPCPAEKQSPGRTTRRTGNSEIGQAKKHRPRDLSWPSSRSKQQPSKPRHRRTGARVSQNPLHHTCRFIS